MKNFIAIILFLTALVSECFGDDQLRIRKLLPENLLVILAIAPEIPEDFVAMSLKGELDAYDWTYWGPKKVLETYFKDPDSLAQSILRVKIAATSQQEIENPDRDEWINMLKQGGYENFADVRLKWGSYPVYAIRASTTEEVLFIAWVGLNEPGGWTMKFQLIYPSSRCKPKISDVKLWENFLSKTQQLTGKLYMKAHGQSMEEGSTIVDQGNARIQIIAEQRRSDHRLQVAMIPLEVGVSFEFHEANVSDWENMPAVEVQGTLTKKEGTSTVIIDHNILTLIKEVSEFSINKETASADTIFHQK